MVFKIVSAQQEFALKESELSGALRVGQLFKRATTQSFLNEYLPINDPKGASLVKPRLQLKPSILLSAGVNHSYTFSRPAATTYSTTDTSTTTVTIIDSYWLQPAALQGVFLDRQVIQRDAYHRRFCSRPKWRKWTCVPLSPHICKAPLPCGTFAVILRGSRVVTD